MLSFEPEEPGVICVALLVDKCLLGNVLNMQCDVLASSMNLLDYKFDATLHDFCHILTWYLHDALILNSNPERKDFSAEEFKSWCCCFLFCRENESSPADIGESETFSPKVSGRRSLYDDGPPNDPNGYFRHPLTAAETAISSEASALAYEYSRLPALDSSGMKIGETNDYKDIIR